MSRELLEQAYDLRAEITEAIESKDQKGLLYLLKDLYAQLMGTEMTEIEVETLEGEIDRFLRDEHHANMKLLFGPEGHLTIWREGGTSFDLSKDVSREISDRWIELQKAA